MVVAYHVIQMSPVPRPGLMRFAVFGQYGVDVFFALSGWLIGRLYTKSRGPSTQRSLADVFSVRFTLNRNWGRELFLGCRANLNIA